MMDINIKILDTISEFYDKSEIFSIALLPDVDDGIYISIMYLLEPFNIIGYQGSLMYVEYDSKYIHTEMTTTDFNRAIDSHFFEDVDFRKNVEAQADTIRKKYNIPFIKDISIFFDFYGFNGATIIRRVREESVIKLLAENPDLEGYYI